MNTVLTRLEVVLWMAGLGLVAAYGVCRADAHFGSAADLAKAERFASPDFSAWAPGRRDAYFASLRERAGPLLGSLRIPALKLVVPLYGDTSELHLNRGAGVIEGTAFPGPRGNVGVAGHRDGFFRVLRGATPGQVIEIRTPQGRFDYRVSSIAIVPQSDARLLASTSVPSVTLVTCYPFYFIGNAPMRFVVRGVLVSTQE